MGCCSYRVTTIVFAILTIIFGIFSIVKQVQYSEADTRKALEQNNAKDVEGKLKTANISNKISLASAVISIITSCLVFAAVSDDMEQNQRRRYFLLPYIIWHAIGVICLIVSAIIIATAYKGEMEVMTAAIIVLVIAIIVTFFFMFFVAVYFRSLSKGGSSYQQYGQVNMVSKPYA